MGNTLKIRVVIDHEEDIFRDFDVPDSESFEAFHKAILNAYNFPNDQMASFYLSNDNWDKGEEIPLFDMSERTNPMATMASLTLGDRVHQERQKLIYVYDFFLMWCFFVEVVEIDPTHSEEITLTNSFGEAPHPQSKEPDLSFDTEDFSDDSFGDSAEEDEEKY